MPQRPKSDDLKKIEGTFRQDRAKKPLQSVPFSVPKCPEWLCKRAKAEWNYTIGELKRSRNVTRLDRGALAMLCTLFAKIVDSEVSGKELSPGLVGHYIKLAMQFGFTPGSRGGVSAEPTVQTEQSKWLSFQRKAIVSHE